MQHVVLLYLAAERTASELAIARLSTVTPTEAIAAATVAEILTTVEHTPGCVGLLPVEDSFEGEDTAVLDRLIFETNRVYVAEEVVVSEALGAFRLPSELTAPRVAVSHPRAIEHSHRFLREHGLATRFVGSAEEACRMVAEANDPTLVAVASREVAEEAGLVPFSAAVDDVPDARTRFFLVGQTVGRRTGSDKTTLVLTQPADRSGSLVKYLQAFSTNEVNLVSLHSRPITRAAGSYCFLATAEAHIQDSRLQAAIAELWEQGAEVKLLGSYPEWEGEQVLAPFAFAPKASVGPHSTEADRARLLDPPVMTPSPEPVPGS